MNGKVSTSIKELSQKLVKFFCLLKSFLHDFASFILKLNKTFTETSTFKYLFPFLFEKLFKCKARYF